jgi:hypothetical protein
MARGSRGSGHSLAQAFRHKSKPSGIKKARPKPCFCKDGRLLSLDCLTHC